ncbi:MAG TPA: hypothetical protein ENH99_02375, partial [Candidatus Pacearchaeota archaeon]|nr:hypothetical protein [Candidatus Pacearchaeota archaeon]
MCLKKNFILALIFIFLFSNLYSLSAVSPNLPNGNLIYPNLANGVQTNNTYNVNYSVTQTTNNINQFDQSLNTTDSVQFNNLTLTGNLNILGNITPSLNNTFSLGSPNLLWKDLYLGDSSIYLGNYILDAFDGNFRIRNKTTNIMYFNATSNEMVFTTNTRTIGFAEGASPLKLREGVQFFNVAGVKGFSIYHAHGNEEWRNVSDIFNTSVVFELDKKDNPYGMDWIVW